MNKNHTLKTVKIAVWTLILMTLVAFATSCSTTKRLVRSVNIESVDTTKVVKKSDSVAVKLTEISGETLANLTLNEDLEVEIKEYDTNKPIDSITGKPPLKREVKASKKLQTTAQNRQKQTIEQSDSVATSRSDTMATLKFFRQTKNEDLKEKTKFVFPWWGIFGGLAIAFLLIYISKKWRIFPQV